MISIPSRSTSARSAVGKPPTAPIVGYRTSRSAGTAEAELIGLGAAHFRLSVTFGDEPQRDSCRYVENRIGRETVEREAVEFFLPRRLNNAYAHG